MPRFTVVSELPAPPAAVFAGIIDLGQWPLFTGYGPLPGIRAASLPAGETVRLGARIRVDDADGSHHYERIEVFEPDRRVALRMELTPPAAHVMADIYEEVTLAPSSSGTTMTRTFTATPRAWYTWPMAWLFGSFMLRRAVLRHNATVAARLTG
jgi:uncharacterized protein YndB with AHSA1/START domain